MHLRSNVWGSGSLRPQNLHTVDSGLFFPRAQNTARQIYYFSAGRTERDRNSNFFSHHRSELSPPPKNPGKKWPTGQFFHIFSFSIFSSLLSEHLVLSGGPRTSRCPGAGGIPSGAAGHGDLRGTRPQRDRGRRRGGLVTAGGGVDRSRNSAIGSLLDFLYVKKAQAKSILTLRRLSHKCVGIIPQLRRLTDLLCGFSRSRLEYMNTFRSIWWKPFPSFHGGYGSHFHVF